MHSCRASPSSREDVGYGRAVGRAMATYGKPRIAVTSFIDGYLVSGKEWVISSDLATASFTLDEYLSDYGFPHPLFGRL